MYLTRRCPRHCHYCNIRDATNVGPELTIPQWKDAFKVLKELKVEFNLILGNEPWLLGEYLVDLLKDGIPYALYSSASIPLFGRYAKALFENGINNLSTGVDYPKGYFSTSFQDDSLKKSEDAWDKIRWVREFYPKAQVHATITVHKLNYLYLPRIVNELTEVGAFSNINFIHWNKDGKYDFFPDEKELKGLLFEKEDHYKLRTVLNEVLQNPGLLQNPQMLEMDTSMLVDMGWHCKGDPYGGPTIDADGRLRVCGYRKGHYTSFMNIFDLPEHEDHWEEAVYQDAMECPGCSWSCPWMFRYWKDNDPEMGAKVFTEHAIKGKK